MPVRPSLPPGVAVLRRDLAHLQIGTYPGLVVRDRPGLVSLLRRLDGVRDIGQLSRVVDPEIADMVGEVVDELLSQGALVDGAQIPSNPRMDVQLRFDQRSEPLAQALETVVDDLRLRPARPADPGLLVQLSTGEPARTHLNALVETAHLIVVIDGLRVRVGPLVVPGFSPCISCLDHDRIDRDPAWAAVLSQLEGPPIASGPMGLHTSARWGAAALIAGEIHDLARGLRPRTAGGILTLDSTQDALSLEPLTFHRRCDCWLLAAS